jgi:hypothetical protein
MLNGNLEHSVGYKLVWLGLAWLGLAWLGLAWLGLAWLGLVLFDFDCFGLKYCIK